MGDQLRAAEERIRELEEQVVDLDRTLRQGTPLPGRSPLVRSASKGLEITLRKRIETLEMELQSLGHMRAQEQVRGARRLGFSRLPVPGHALRICTALGG